MSHGEPSLPIRHVKIQGFRSEVFIPSPFESKGGCIEVFLDLLGWNTLQIHCLMVLDKIGGWEAMVVSGAVVANLQEGDSSNHGSFGLAMHL